ncbi:hypothetical protein, partial [Vibrio kanaloae]|uniref:hypothetical protein n=1 Tax=Vibrio kanaloae TaxID=170673 RepID=UPI001A7E1515
IARRATSIGFCKVGTLYRPFCFRQPKSFHSFFPFPPASLFLLLLSNSTLQPVSKTPSISPVQCLFRNTNTDI